MIISNGNRTEWSPIRSVIITSEKQNWMSTERENYNFRKISKAVISRLKNYCC